MDEIRKGRFSDFSLLGSPEWNALAKLKGSLYALRLILGMESGQPFLGDDTSCIPFSWVEPLAQEADHCGFETYLADQLSAPVEMELLRNYYEGVFRRWILDYSHPRIEDLFYTQFMNLDGVQVVYSELLSEAIRDLEDIEHRTSWQNTRLVRYRDEFEISRKWSGVEVAQHLVQQLNLADSRLDELIKLSEKEKLGAVAKLSLQATQKHCRESLESIRALLRSAASRAGRRL